MKKYKKTGIILSFIVMFILGVFFEKKQDLISTEMQATPKILILSLIFVILLVLCFFDEKEKA
ncbi:hypothetical protein ACFFU1_16690 [Algibacter miyuki]|uniref:ATP synthase F0 sector subunit C n=1 Tax=Algibacter miyuki TaxID=1306933 RepID=A0ABV5H3U0_9FLAO|nr:hypothetical protein [Algibacter miyuki]MDN3665617.1 hypothetical protein [Algibacter miyuki]